jgi:hypothetical protein
VLTLVVAVGSARLLLQFIRDRSHPAPVFLLGAVFVPAVLASFPPSIYPDSRYVFHLYPLLVLIFAATAVAAGRRLLAAVPAGGRLGRGAVAVALALVVLFASQDANPIDAWSVGSQTYRTRKNPMKGPNAWEPYGVFHQDLESPSRYVRDRLAPGDLVVVFGISYVIAIYSHYIGRADYAVGRPDDAVNRLRTRDGVLVDYITGAKVVTDLPELSAIIEGHSGGAVWLLGDLVTLAPDTPGYDAPVKDYLTQLARHPDYLGLDGRTFVTRAR